MSLLRPTPGECYDRLSILELKLKHGGGSHFQDEKLELQTYLLKSSQTVWSEQEEKLHCDLTTELAKVNTTLWRLEDDRRKLFKEVQVEVLEVVHNAQQTTQLNDIRAKLIQGINTLYGIDQREKLYEAN